MKKSNLKNLNVTEINANMVKGGRKLRPGMGNGGWPGWGGNGTPTCTCNNP